MKQPAPPGPQRRGAQVGVRLGSPRLTPWIGDAGLSCRDSFLLFPPRLNDAAKSHALGNNVIFKSLAQILPLGQHGSRPRLVWVTLPGMGTMAFSLQFPSGSSWLPRLHHTCKPQMPARSESLTQPVTLLCCSLELHGPAVTPQ